jgi:hypothetical protein
VTTARWPLNVSPSLIQGMRLEGFKYSKVFAELRSQCQAELTGY